LASLLRQEALALENEEGVEGNLTLGASLYCRSACLGDAQAQVDLG
jgi:hypothetical protein